MNSFISEFFDSSNIGQSKRLGQVERTLETELPSVRSDLEMFSEKIENNKDNIEQLALLFRTLYEICLSKKVFTKPEFKELFTRIDLMDGKQDGKLSKPG